MKVPTTTKQNKSDAVYQNLIRNPHAVTDRERRQVTDETIRHASQDITARLKAGHVVETCELQAIRELTFNSEFYLELQRREVMS